jgi:C4-dicarboxylate-specific signal transduction histidine kinase
MSAARTPEEIRRSIEANRADLALAVETLRIEVAKATDWKAQLRAHQREVVIGAAVAGFVLGGGIAAFTGLLTGRRSSRYY